MKKMILILICLLLFCGCAQPSAAPSEPTVIASEAPTVPPTEPPSEAPTEPPTEPIVYIDMEPGSYLERFEDSETGNYFDYYLHIPNNATEGMPLFVFLHGDGEVGAAYKLENYGPIQAARDIYGENFPFIAVFPCTRVQSWVMGTIPQTLIDLLDYTADRFNADTSRIMLTGHSRGSIGVWNLISKYGDYFCCAVPISCGPESNMDFENCAKVPVRAVVGRIGELENLYGIAMKRTVEKLAELGGDAEIIVMEKMAHEHTSTAAYSQEMFDWMLSCEVEDHE